MRHCQQSLQQASMIVRNSFYYWDAPILKIIYCVLRIMGLQVHMPNQASMLKTLRGVHAPVEGVLVHQLKEGHGAANVPLQAASVASKYYSTQ